MRLPYQNSLYRNSIHKALRRSAKLARAMAIAAFLLMASGLTADRNYPLPLAITGLKLTAPYTPGNDRNPIYTYSMSDAMPAPELLFVSNRAYLVWTDASSNGRVSLLKPDLSAVEKDLVRLPGRRIGDAVTDGKSITLLALEWDKADGRENLHTAHIESYSTSGQVLFKDKIVGARSYEAIGSQGLATSFSTFNLAWSGKQYAAYFTTYRKWDDGVVHQSEYLALYDASGKRIMDDNRPAGWTWNVSHSFRPRISWDGKRFLMSTVGDAYPRGLVVQSYPSTGRETVIEVPKAAPGETYQNVVISTGDVYGSQGQGWVVFDRRLNRTDYDIGLIRTGEDGKPGSPIWITRTSNSRERIPRIQPLGDDLLIAWAVDESGHSPDKAWYPVTGDMVTHLTVIRKDGTTKIAPFPVPARIRGATRLFQFPNGDVGWVNDATGEPSNMEIVRIAVPGSQVTDNTEEDPNTEVVNPVQVEYDPALDLPLLQSAYRGDAAAVQGFLSKGANPNASFQGWYALHYAAYYGHETVCEVLLKAGADPEQTVQGWSALQLAENQGHSAIAEILKPVSKNRKRSLKPVPNPESHSRMRIKPRIYDSTPATRNRFFEPQGSKIGPPKNAP